MSQIFIGSELVYDVGQSTIFLFQIAAARTPHQIVHNENLSFDPWIEVEEFAFGQEANRMQRAQVEPCRLKIRYEATIEATPGIERPPEVAESTVGRIAPEALPYMNPSRYCESDLLARFAYEEFGQTDRGFARVQAICDWVFEHLTYTPGSTDSTTTAADVLLQRTGVCRDYAHLAIALCRGIGIPARYVSGYAVDLQPPDFHGFMEAYLDGHWYLFDPTRLASTLGLVRVGAGRDAADVAFSTITGQAMLAEKSVWANYADAIPSDTENPAVSTA